MRTEATKREGGTMKGRDVQIGGRYIVKVSGNLVTVKVLSEYPRHGWDGTVHSGWKCLNLDTGRTILVKSAQRFRWAVSR